MKAKLEIENIIYKLEKLFELNMDLQNIKRSQLVATMSYDIKETLKYVLNVDSKIEMFIKSVVENA